MATSDVGVTPGSGKFVASYSFTEDGKTKEAQRIALNDSAGADVMGLLTLAPAQHSLLDRLRLGSRLIVAVGDTLTRPASTTAYSAGDSVSNHATAGSVTPTKVDLSAWADTPVDLEKITVDCNDLGFVNCVLAMHLFSSDPTANTGVGAGDNVAWSNKRAGYLGRFEGFFRTFSDGLNATLLPTEGNSLILLPGAGTQRLWFQYQILSNGAAMTSGSQLIPTFRGRQGMA
jgi:hypothetical protein